MSCCIACSSIKVNIVSQRCKFILLPQIRVFSWLPRRSLLSGSRNLSYSKINLRIYNFTFYCSTYNSCARNRIWCRNLNNWCSIINCTAQRFLSFHCCLVFCSYSKRHCTRERLFCSLFLCCTKVRYSNYEFIISTAFCYCTGIIRTL